MKLCKGCSRLLDVSEFSVNRRSADNLDWRCRRCKAEYSRRYIHSEKGKATRRAYLELERVSEKQASAKRRKRAIYARENPEKIRCRWLLGNAVRRGYIQRPDKSRNWHNRWEFHHPDHSRPYYGVWLSASDHRLIDMGKKRCPPCVDYAGQVKKLLLADWGL